MEHGRKERESFSRRHFIRGIAAGISGSAIAGSGLSERAAGAVTMIAPQTSSFEIPPPQIPASEIREAIDTDIVVIGAGTAGMCAALSAVEAGAKTVLLEKKSSFTGRGWFNAAIGSEIQEQAGIRIDKNEVVAEIMKSNNYRGDQRLCNLWADHSGEAMNWLVNMAKAEGLTPQMPQTTTAMFGPVKSYPTGISFGGQAKLIGLLEKRAESKGVDIMYNTPAARLLRERKGRVTGVIARTEKGDHIQLNVDKAVVLCSGGYDADREMMEKYLRTVDLNSASPTQLHELTGDGHKIGLWIGAAMEDPPHCMMNSMGALHQGPPLALAGLPWLWVNRFGERFVQEHLWRAHAGNAIQSLPGRFAWAVWDGKWQQDAQALGLRPNSVQRTEEAVASLVAKGALLKADTVEGLAAKMQVPDPSVFKAAVERYSELARLKGDQDFGKDPKFMTSIGKAPYYACKVGPSADVTLSGLKINSRLQVLGTDEVAIPGLYAAGNVSGGMFVDTYPGFVNGLSHGRAFTFGRLAALNAARQAPKI